MAPGPAQPSTVTITAASEILFSLIGLMSVLGHDDELHMVLASRQTPGRVETASFEVVRQAMRLLARWRWQLWFGVVILEACASTGTLASDMWMFAARGGDILHGNLGAVYSWTAGTRAARFSCS
jgi:hypothetical protein